MSPLTTEELLDMFDRYNEAMALTSLGNSHQAAGDGAEARVMWQRAAAILDQLGHPDTYAAGARLR